MGCISCTTGGCGTKGMGEKTSGCKNNGACGTGGCNKMNVFDWLSNMEMPSANQYPIVEVKFKGGRKEYFHNVGQIELYTGDPVIVEVPNGHHLGFVSLQGELVRLQVNKKGLKDEDTQKAVYRKANEKDIEKHEQSVARDLPTMYRTREIVSELGLNMKLSDVEYQSDGTKATFYYSSDERVDFRELIKLLAAEFKIRIEMKQISLRQEAARLGGVGVCGRELCCSTWLTDFKNVNTSAARYQNLSLNPAKLSGQCGRLKCCLNYELETYIDALKDIPILEEPILTKKGKATLQKTDIFKKIMWFGYDGDEMWHPVPVEQIKEIIEMVKRGEIPQSLDVLTESLDLDKALIPPGLNSDLDRYEKYDKSGKPKRTKGKENTREGKENTRERRTSEPVAKNGNNKPLSTTPPTAKVEPVQSKPTTEKPVSKVPTRQERPEKYNNYKQDNRRREQPTQENLNDGMVKNSDFRNEKPRNLNNRRNGDSRNGDSRNDSVNTRINEPKQQPQVKPEPPAQRNELPKITGETDTGQAGQENQEAKPNNNHRRRPFRRR
jgi:cell fate regulator YaaT (PSP1 superfamily)